MKKLGLILGLILVLLALGIGALALFGQGKNQGTTVKSGVSSSQSTSGSNKESSKNSSSTLNQALDTAETKETSSSQAQTAEKESASDEFAALQAGDYQSLEGSWSNGDGYTVEITADGKTSDGSKLSLSNQNNNYLQGSITSPNAGGAAFIYLPAGVPYVVTDANGNQLTIESDISRQRLLIVQALPTESSFYYRN